jgi:hypothetical protein
MAAKWRKNRKKKKFRCSIRLTRWVMARGAANDWFFEPFALLCGLIPFSRVILSRLAKAEAGSNPGPLVN